MSSIEERLVRDIAAVTGGVVVTESDLRIARDAVDERIGNRRLRDRRFAVIAAAAAAVLVLILGVVTFQALGGDTKTAPPANPGPTTSDPEADYLTGSAPTPDLLQGVWRVDDGTVLMRFWPPNFVSFDDGGRLFHDPGVQGTYVITGDLITISVDGGPAGCAGQQLAVRASLPEPGKMRFVHTQPGTANCAPEQNGRWVLEQVLPTSQGLAENIFSADPGWQPLSGQYALDGSWLAEGGGYVLELARGGSYYVADDSAEPVDQGQWSFRGSDLTLTSSADSATCNDGDQLVLGRVQYVDPGTTAIRSTVKENTCGAAWAPAVWILIPHEGS